MEPYQEYAPPLQQQQQQQQQRVDEHLGVPVGKHQLPPPPPISNELGSKNQQYPQAYPTVESVIKQYSPIQSAYAASTTAAYIPPPPQANKDFEESAKVQVEAAATSQAPVPEEPTLTEPAPSASTAYTIRRPILRYEQANPFISVLKMNVGDSVWIKFDSMAAYHGMFSFTRQNLIETGVMGRIRSSIQNAVTPALVKATAQVDNSSLYLADKGKRIIVLYLQAYETITINATNLVSMEATVVWEILLQKSLSTLLQGGLFNMRCTGPGFVAVSTEREPLVLYATPERPIITDPHNTILWSSQLGVALNSDIKLKSLLGKLTGDDFQMVFTGSGYVMIDAGK